MSLDEKEKDILSKVSLSYLEALRQREQEVFRYLVILGPAIGGFIWLLYQYPPGQKINEPRFFLASIGLQFLFLLGAAYTSALGYNHRYLIFQLMMIEKKLKITCSVFCKPAIKKIIVG